MGGETFLNKEGQKVTLDQLAMLMPSGTSVIQEKDGHPYAVVTANIISSDIGKVTKQVKVLWGKFRYLRVYTIPSLVPHNKYMK